MANRRMINFSLIDSDDFIDMSAGARLLFLTIQGKTDDDGFLDGLKSICRLQNIDEKSVSELVKAGFILDCSKYAKSGVYLITHWLLMNAIESNKYNPTNFLQACCHVAIIDKKYCLVENQDDGLLAMNPEYGEPCQRERSRTDNSLCGQQTTRTLRGYHCKTHKIVAPLLVAELRERNGSETHHFREEEQNRIGEDNLTQDNLTQDNLTQLRRGKVRGRESEGRGEEGGTYQNTSGSQVHAKASVQRIEDAPKTIPCPRNCGGQAKRTAKGYHCQTCNDYVQEYNEKQ